MSQKLRQSRIISRDTNSPEKGAKSLYFHEIITDDRNYIPPSATDVYEVKAEILSLHKKIDQVLAGKPSPVRNRQVARPDHKSPWALPPALSSISDAIQKSKEIINRTPDPSNDLALVCAEKTWRRAINILVAHAKAVWQKARVRVKPPDISAGPKGSVDLYWPPSPYGLLLNVPANQEESATFYGDDAENPDSNHTSGKMNPKRPIDPGVFAWLAYMGEE